VHSACTLSVYDHHADPEEHASLSAPTYQSSQGVGRRLATKGRPQAETSPACLLVSAAFLALSRLAGAQTRRPRWHSFPHRLVAAELGPAGI